MSRPVPSRRLLLQGAGVSLALPFLHSALPRAAWAQSITAPKRFLTYFIPNGLSPDGFVPTKIGPDYDLKTVLAPIAALQHRMTPISGISNKANPILTHEAATSGLLTDTEIEVYGVDLNNGISVDQVAAAANAGVTPFASLQAGADSPAFFDTGNSSTYIKTLAWAANATPLPNITSPKTLFDRMFAGIDPGLTEAQIAQRAVNRTSVLDAVLDRVNALSGRLGTGDVAKLDQYATAVRELEVKIALIEDLQCTAPDVPPEAPGFFETVTLMEDLMVVALQCDMTRIITWMTSPSTAATSYDFLGFTDTHHALSHNYLNGGANLDKYMQIQAWNVERFTSLCQKLADITDADGNDLLAHTWALFASEFHEAGYHQSDELPCLLAGGEAGGIVQGQHRVFPGENYGNLHLAALQFLGIPQTTFGDHGYRAMTFT